MPLSPRVRGSFFSFCSVVLCGYRCVCLDYKGRASAKTIEKDFPYIVEMQVPLGGFGKKLDAMYEWFARHGINQ